jgi:CRISPR-associated endonuclease/helicase Cas3
VLDRKPPADILHGTPAALPPHVKDPGRLEFWTRMLFSALCDADFLDTERFYDESKSALRQPGPTLEVLAQRLTTYLDEKERQAPATEVNRVRSEVRRACLQAAPERPGCFSLTVPTGGGKTLAAMAFALEHARLHGLERVIVAIPYTSIIEQSAEVYRAALDYDVLEHHSAFDPKKETPQNRVAAENWDAPIVVTTTVQLFESLFANRPSACRKLHHLAKSVIVLDEAQTLPPGMLAPIVAGLRALVTDYGASLVISTATQPVLGKQRNLPEGLDAIREMVPASVNAFARLHRVRVRWPTSPEPIPYEALADELVKEPDVLAIVHRRSDARDLCLALDARAGAGSTLHLSALMCPEHRSVVLGRIKELKKAGQPVRLVATQLVEAGVDLDFPVVYRALGGLESMAQAAGRCNREGKLPGLGELRVFRALSPPPRGVPQQALEVTQGMLTSNAELNLFAPETFRRYFAQLYGAGSLDVKAIEADRKELRFRTVAKNFKIVEDDWSAPIVVPYEGRAVVLLEALEKYGPSRDRMRRLQRLTVTVKKRDRELWLKSGAAREVAETVIALYAGDTAYEDRFGLVPSRVGTIDPSKLIG